MGLLHECILCYAGFPVGFMSLSSVLRIAVGMPVSRHPPRSSVRAAFLHTAPTSDEWRKRYALT
jgi:hypothetical protein